MIDANFVKAITDEHRRPQNLEIDGKERLLKPAGWSEVHEHDWQPDALNVATLSAVVAYLKENRDGLALGELVVLVEAPDIVELVGKLREPHKVRDRHMRAFTPRDAFVFGHFHDAESFIVALQHQFTDAGQRDELLNLVGAIRESEVRETLDEGGYAQNVKTGRGVTMVGEQKIANPITLAPFRTFSEVAQPESAFVLRLRPGGDGDDRPRLALFEADGGAWRLKATELVASYLVAALADASVEVPVLA